MLLIGFHGGSEHHYLAAFGDHGESIAKEVLTDAPVKLEPRAFAVVSPGTLWLADGSKDDSALLAFNGSGSSYSGPGTAVAAYPAIVALWHPFDFAFSPDGAYCFVSNQDTNVVVRLSVTEEMSPTPVAPALPTAGTFLPGTFVASADGALPGVTPTTVVPTDQGGLKATVAQGKVSHSVRGVTMAGTTLYVADEPDDAVKAYDPDGAFLGRSSAITAPVHLVADASALYASAADGVHRAPLVAGALAFEQVLELDGAAGMAFGANGDFFVANRKDATVSAYHGFDPASPGKPDVWKVAASPEFVSYQSR